jgi:ABC-type bacteriocin/lantibiotic exporter with double-glycine peptidase domain
VIAGRSDRPRHAWLEIGLLSILAGLLGLVVPMSVDVLLDQAVPSRSLLMVGSVAALYVALGGLIAWLEYRRGRRLQDLFIGWSEGLFDDLVMVLAKTPLEFHRQRSPATIVTRALGIERAREALTAGMLGVTVSSAVFVASGFYLAWLQPVIGVTVLAALGLMGLGHVLLVWQQVTRRRETAACETREAAFVAAAIHARSAITTRQTGTGVHKQWRVLHDLRIAASRRTQVLRDLQQAIDLAVTFWGPALFFLVLLASGGALSEGEIAAAYAAFGQCLLAVYTLSHASGYLVHVEEGRTLYRDLLEAPQRWPGHVEAALDNAVAVQARDAVLVLGDATAVLGGVNFSVAQGHCVALVGRSGAGKSSLMRLINGVDLPSAGSIAIFGVPPEHYGDATARKLLGCPTTWEGFLALTQSANAPHLILVDELFDAIDGGLVADALATARGRGLTVIAATHRHCDLPAFDRVIFLHKRVLAGCAPHAGLVEQNADYRHLFVDIQ